MLIKWVACRVVNREAFHRAQRAWVELHGLPGFLGQCGGWSRREDGLAHIIACWADEPSYQAFMTGSHDEIAAAQIGTYGALDVRLFDHRLDIGEGFLINNGRAALLRLAYCHVRTHRQAHFIQAQTEVWNPGMAAAPGMRGGMFAERAEAEFLVMSLWRSTADHEGYLVGRFMELRRLANAAEDLDAVTGDLVDLEPAWTVPM
ncbi:DUF4937 domain-containing protein [Actinomycetes bacterium KLBMP 9797]